MDNVEFVFVLYMCRIRRYDAVQHNQPRVCVRTRRGTHNHSLVRFDRQVVNCECIRSLHQMDLCFFWSFAYDALIWARAIQSNQKPKQLERLWRLELKTMPGNFILFWQVSRRATLKICRFDSFAFVFVAFATTELKTHSQLMRTISSFSRWPNSRWKQPNETDLDCTNGRRRKRTCMTWDTRCNKNQNMEMLYLNWQCTKAERIGWSEKRDGLSFSHQAIDMELQTCLAVFRSFFFFPLPALRFGHFE